MAPDNPCAMLRSWVEVDLDAIRHNLAALRAQLSPGVRVMAVVKANAYGHGSIAVVNALAGLADIFGVANLNEAREIAVHARGTPIFLLNAMLPAEHAAIGREGFIPVVSSFEEAAGYASAAAGATVRAHLAVDTGMGRVGVWESEVMDSARRIMALPGLELTGIASHLPVADEDDTFTRGQLARFLAIADQLRSAGLRDALVHVENSAGIIAFPESAGTLVRPGLAIYGESPLPAFQPRLRRALAWKSRIALVRDMGPGRSVSYGRTFITRGPMRVATLAVGYADGYPRGVSGRGASVIISGTRCAILGRVTMDQIMADVTGLDVAPGDEAVLLGRMGGEEISASDLALLAGTIPWEILTGIGQRVTRLYRGGDSSASQTGIPA